MKIAVIDENEIQREFIVTALMYCVNRDVLAFGNGHLAWKHMEKEDVDIVLTDANLTDMAGVELVSKFKQKYPDKICILMSGNPASENDAVQFGADGFLAKPFSINDLFDIVQAFVVEGS